MALDERYFIAPSLEMYFVNKDSGLPLSNGKVFFYKDDARSVPKPVYQISGAPPNYSYSVLPNPSILSSVGTFQDDSGNDIIPYYFPYNANGNLELYYIEVYDENDVLQFTREGWPNLTTSQITANQDVTNFVPNGQFLLHNNVPASSANSFVAGVITQPVTIIGQGGWTFERDIGSTATDIVTFPRYGSAVTFPTGNPRYAVQIQTTIAGSDTRKDLCLKFPDVNTFASDVLSYNLYFEGQSSTGSNITNVQVVIRKFFGAGGSATTETVVTSLTLTPSIQSFNTSLLFGTNENQTIGTGNDDYVQVILRLPPTGVQTALMTDFAITVDNEILTQFPTQTNAEQLDQSTAGWLPSPAGDGSDLYLPIIYTPSGCDFDRTVIGKVNGSFYPTAKIGELLCDGTQYRTNDYSSDGIPYSRLQQVLFNSTYKLPIFGTGVNYLNCYLSTGNTNMLVLSLNKVASVQTNPADGAVATTFTFNTIVNNTLTLNGFRCASNSGGIVTAFSTFSTGPLAPPSNGTSGMTINDYTSSLVTGELYCFTFQSLTAASLAAGIGIAGKYFEFSNHTTTYRMWFFVNGEIAPAAGGHTLYRVNLTPGLSAVDTASIIADAISSTQDNSISTIAAASMTPGAYFTFNANSVLYTVWYEINAVGTAPVGSRLIKVALVGNETAVEVASKTQIAINTEYFAVPDLRGLFLRGADPTGIWDLDVTNRWGYINTISATGIGSYELNQLLNHIHSAFNRCDDIANIGSAQVIAVNQGLSDTKNLTNIAIGAQGGVESRPVNVNVNWYIKY